MDRPPLQDIDVDAALRTILRAPLRDRRAVFQGFGKKLAAALNTHGAWVTEYFPESRRLKALAFWMGEQWLEGWEMVVDGTPCERSDRRALPDSYSRQSGRDLRQRSRRSSRGRGELYGHAAARSQWRYPRSSGGPRYAADAPEPRAQVLFQIFAARAAAELRRLRVEAQVREREQKLGRLVGSAMDAIIEVDQHLQVTQMNPAAEKVFGCAAAEAAGRPDLYSFFDSRFARKAGALDHRPRHAARRTAVSLDSRWSRGDQRSRRQFSSGSDAVAFRSRTRAFLHPHT